MNRVILLLLTSIVAALAIVYGLRIAQRTSNAAVTALLPRETIVFVHLPDFNRTRDQWRQSDIYQLYREPAVQDFLRKPLTRVSNTDAITRTAHDMQQLDLKDGFLALTSLANEAPKFVGGFRFRGSPEEAEAIVARWRDELAGPATQHETVNYQQHKIDVVTAGAKGLATAYDRNWFFASNDLAELKALLDRADGRASDQKNLLIADEAFREAIAEMPVSYSLLLYLQPKVFAEKLASLRAAVGQPATAEERTLFQQMRSICATTQFENGKMHDVIFLGMPRQPQAGRLSRQSLALASRDTFVYLASLINFSKQLALFQPGAGGAFLGGVLQKIGNAMAAANIKPDDWTAAFGSELGTVADWSADAHWPSVIVTSAVKDSARARSIIGALLRGIDEDAFWKETERDGVHYWAMQNGPGFVAIRPVIAMSNRVLIAGLDQATVESALRRSEASTSELASSETYKRCIRNLPEPTNFFGYIDLALLYLRLDATLRPMLLMSAAFMPAINDYADLGKLPAAEIVTRHLTPIVSSQRYKGNGYIAESLGPITLNESGIAVGLVAGKAALGYQRSAPVAGPLSSPSSSPSGPSPSGGWTGRGLKIPQQLPVSPTPSATP